MSGKPAARVGDKVAGNVIVSGSATVLIGDAGQGCADKACKGSPSVGSPVNPMLGVKVLPGETDFALAAPSPFAFTRSYASDDARIGPLGQGWSIPGASLYLEVSETATVMVDPQGRRITFDALAPGESLFSPSESLWIRRGGPVPGEGAPPPKAWDGRWIGVPEAVQRNPHAIVAMSASDHDAHVFLAGPTRWRLAQVVDRNGYATEYQWSATGDLRAICDSAGRIYALVYVAHPTTRAGDPGLRLAGVVLAFDPGRDDRPRATFDPLAPDNDWLVRYGHDAEGDLVEVTDRMGHAVRYFGYRQHIMVRHGQPGGIDVHYVYDAYTPQGRVLAQRQADGLDYAFEYGEHRTVVKDSLGRVDEYHFAGQGGLRRLARHVRADGSVVTRQYDAAGRLVAVVDPLGRVTRFRLDGEGRQVGVTRPDGVTDFSRHDPRTGDLVAIEGPEGPLISIERDVRGNPLVERTQDGSVTRYIYGNPALPNRPVRIEDAAGRVHHMTWNGMGQMVRHEDCSGRVTRYGFDPDGNLIEVIDAQGRRTGMNYDVNGRLLGIAKPGGANWSFRRHGLGGVTCIVDAAGAETRIDRDRWGRMIGKISPSGRCERYEHDEAGHLKTLQNGNGARFAFDHDAMGRLIKEIGFDGRTVEYGYDLGGQLVEVRQGPGRGMRFHRNLMGEVERVTSFGMHGEPECSFQYKHDRHGRVVESMSPDAVVHLGYDRAGRLISEKQRHADGWTYQVLHEYGESIRPHASLYDGMPRLEWMMYGPGHLHGVRLGDHGLDFERDALHREVARHGVHQQKRTGLRMTRAYDETGLAQQSLEVSGHMLWERVCEWDIVGRLVRVQDDGGQDRRHDYDRDGWLIRSWSGHEGYAYAWDDAGNLLGKDGFELGQENRVGVACLDDRVKGVSGVEVRYDPDGRVVSRRTAQGHVQTFRYDGLDRMTQVRIENQQGSFVVRYGYDAFGRRIRKTIFSDDASNIPVAVRRYGWEGDRMVAECDGIIRRTIVYEPDSFVPMMCVETKIRPADEAMAPLLDFIDRCAGGRQERADDSMTVSLLHVDHLGTPMRKTDVWGRLEWAANGDDWAAVAPLDPGKGIHQPLRFQGQYFDDETGLCYNRYRFYDPVLGRYLSQDPIGLIAQTNPYTYMVNPTGGVDPYGLWASGYGSYVHQRAGYLVFGKEVSPAELKAIADGHAYADSAQFQDIGSSNRHAMRRPGQSVSDACLQANKFVRQQFKKAWAAADAGDRILSMKEFAVGLHTLQDATSPSHSGFQEWDGHITTDHILKDTKILDPGSNEPLMQTTRDGWNWYKSRKLPNGNLFRCPC